MEKLNDKQKELCKIFLENSEKVEPWEKFLNPFTNKQIVKGSASYTKQRKECQSISFELFIKKRKQAQLSDETEEEQYEIATKQEQKTVIPTKSSRSPLNLSLSSLSLSSKNSSPKLLETPKNSPKPKKSKSKSPIDLTPKSTSSKKSKSLSLEGILSLTQQDIKKRKSSIQSPEMSPEESFRLYFTPSPKSDKSKFSQETQTYIPEMKLYLSSNSRSPSQKSKSSSPKSKYSEPISLLPDEEKTQIFSSSTELSPEMLSYLSRLPKEPKSPSPTRMITKISTKKQKKSVTPSPKKSPPMYYQLQPTKPTSDNLVREISKLSLSPKKQSTTKQKEEPEIISPEPKYDLNKCKKIIESDSKLSDGDTIKNPFTNKTITKGKPTYKKLLKECIQAIKDFEMAKQTKVSPVKSKKSKRLSTSGEFDLKRFLEED